MSIAELENLISNADPNSRSEIDAEELREATQQDLDKFEELLKLEMRRLTLESKRAADAFWLVREEAVNEGSEPGKLGTQVRLHNDNHQAIWFTGSFTHVDGSSGDKNFYAKHIPKSRGRNSHRYPPSTFSRSPEWERDIAMTVEEYYANNRKKAQILMEMRRLLKKYRKINDVNGSSQHS